MKLYRLTRALSPEGAFDGEGSRKYGGRWNGLGTRMVYTSGAISLATLEVIVHLNSKIVLSDYNLFTYDLDEKDVTIAQNLPPDWAHYPAPSSTQEFGDAWVHARNSLALQVPSAIITTEYNYLINPLHPDFDLKKVQKVEHHFDLRLMEQLRKGI